MLEEKQLFSEEKTDVVEGNRMLEVLVSNLTGSKPTRENALEMYRRFGSHTAFARADIMETVGITLYAGGRIDTETEECRAHRACTWRRQGQIQIYPEIGVLFIRDGTNVPSV